MRDCKHCQRIRNGTCAGLECQGFIYTGEIDIDVLKAAEERAKNSRPSGSPYGSSKVAAAAERVKEAEAIKKRQCIEVGRTLWYKNKTTGEICSGVVLSVEINQFLFRFGSHRAWLDYSDVIDKRLFYTKDEALVRGKLQTE